MTVLCFYLAGALLITAYLLYPLLLVLLGVATLRVRKQDEALQPEQWPSVSVVFSAYNEEELIDARISNLLASSYPGPKELIVVSDGSQDRTVEVVSKRTNDTVRLVSLTTRVGKESALNAAIPHARGEILVLTDADCEFSLRPDAITELVRPFFDPTIGLSTGTLKYLGSSTGNAYQRFEDFLRRLESRWGVIAGALGPIYAIRKSLWEPAVADVITDFFHPILVCLKGSRSVAVSNATAVTAMGHEFNRQVRMVAQGALVYFSTLPRLIRSHRWKCVLVLTCHKLLRWLTLPLFFVLLASSFELSGSGVLFRAVFVSQLAFLTFAMLGRMATSLGLPEWLELAYRFVYLNCAAVVGLAQYIRGMSPVVWEPRTK